MRRMRWLVLIAMLGGCAFDPGGTILGTDEGADASTVIDAPSSNIIDAAPSLPIDGAPVTPIDAAPEGCDEMSDCPGQECCIYAGGLASACSPTCLGGVPVCEQDADCANNDRCCENLWGPKTCGFCF